MADTLPGSVTIAQGLVAGNAFTARIEHQTVVSTVSRTTVHTDGDGEVGSSILTKASHQHCPTTQCHICCDEHLI